MRSTSPRLLAVGGDRKGARRRQALDPPRQAAGARSHAVADEVAPAQGRQPTVSVSISSGPSADWVESRRSSGRWLRVDPRVDDRDHAVGARDAELVPRACALFSVGLAGAAHHEHLIVVELAALDQRREARDRLRARLAPGRRCGSVSRDVRLAVKVAIHDRDLAPLAQRPAELVGKLQQRARPGPTACSAIVTGLRALGRRDRAAGLQLGAQHARQAQRQLGLGSQQRSKCAFSIRSSSVSRSARIEALRTVSLNSASSPSTAPRVSVLIRSTLHLAQIVPSLPL